MMDQVVRLPKPHRSQKFPKSVAAQGGVCDFRVPARDSYIPSPGPSKPCKKLRRPSEGAMFTAGTHTSLFIGILFLRRGKTDGTTVWQVPKAAECLHRWFLLILRQSVRTSAFIFLAHRCRREKHFGFALTAGRRNEYFFRVAATGWKKS